MTEEENEPPPRPARRARVTLRCLTQDLQVPVPPATASIEDLGDAHAAIGKAYDLAGSFPLNQEPVESLRHVGVFKFPVGAFRAATWLDRETNVVWLLAYGIRRGGAAYAHFQDLHNAGHLLPEHRDEIRDRAESEIRFLRAITTEIPTLIDQATSAPRTEVSGQLAGAIDVAVYFDGSGEMMELWVAVSRGDPRRGFISDERILSIFGVFERAVEADLSEERDNWPGTRNLDWYEVARLYVA